MRNLPRIASIVVNTNEGDQLLGCLDSLSASGYQNHGILVVDNASTEDSSPEIVRRFPNVDILPLEDNRGYAAALNRGMSHLGSRFDAYFLLNPDVRVDPDCITRLAEAVMEDPRIGVAGPAIYDPQHLEDLLALGSRIHPWTLATKHFVESRNAVSDVPYVTGCAILVTREAYDRAGPMDESYFLYYEEVDYCHIVREGGYRVAVVPSAKAWHRDISLRQEQRPHQVYFGHRNRIRFLRKHGSLAQRTFQAFYLPAVHAPFMILELASLKGPRAVRFYLHGLLDGLLSDKPEPTWLSLDSLFPHPSRP